MLLTITTTYRPATDLGYLLRKNPARVQTFELSFGKAHVFYPEADERRSAMEAEEASRLFAETVVVIPGAGRSAEWSHIHPFGVWPSGRRHDRGAGVRAAQSGA